LKAYLLFRKCLSEAVVTGVSFLGAGTIIRNQSENQLVFHTLAGDKFGHERPSDRARNILLDYANFLTT
jgi:hypothetical protein